MNPSALDQQATVIARQQNPQLRQRVATFLHSRGIEGADKAEVEVEGNTVLLLGCRRHWRKPNSGNPTSRQLT